MAAPIHYIVLSLILSSLLRCETSKIHRSIQAGHGSNMARANSGCSSSQGFNGAGLILHHRYGPCSGLGGQKPTPLDLLHQDQYRVSWLQTRVRNSRVQAEEETTIPAQLGSPLGTSNYIIIVGFGTPKKDLTLEFDTGSDLTWIQCQPCSGRCYEQQDPVFDPTQSSTYASLPCNSSECTQLSSRCSSSSCQYSVTYGDKSKTIGSYARETLTLTPSDVLPGFLFGCGHNNKGLFGGEAGLLGLGRGTESLVTQTVKKYSGVFSYCLPSSENSTGYLTFGAENAPSGIGYTPMQTNSLLPTLYSVNLTGISVNGQLLSIASSTFAATDTIVDSGTVISRLPRAANAVLTSAVREAMPSQVTSYKEFGTCYDMGEKVVVPKITLHMKDLDVELDEVGVFFKVNELLGCLAFLDSEDDVTIIGNTQQRTFAVVYDVPNGRVGFSAGGCT